jgi:hypothetical protein
MARGPTVIDTIRGVKEDGKKVFINVVSTVKSARHTAGHLSFGSNVKNFRKNAGMAEEGAVEKIRGKISSEETIVPRPGIFVDNEGRPKFPIYNQVKKMTKGKDEDDTDNDSTPDGNNNNNTQDDAGDQTLQTGGSLFGADLD